MPHDDFHIPEGDYDTDWHTATWGEALDNEARLLAPLDPGSVMGSEFHFTPYDARYWKHCN